MHLNEEADEYNENFANHEFSIEKLTSTDFNFIMSAKSMIGLLNTKEACPAETEQAQ